MSARPDAPARWRAFGRRADLDVDFAGGSRPRVVVDVLARCRDGAHAGSDLWDLSLSRRVLALLRVLALTEERDALEVTVRCPEPGCGESFALSLDHQALADHAGPDDARLGFDHAETGPAWLRRPTGRDQLAWLARDYAAQADARAAIARSLVVEGALPEHEEGEWLGALAEAMEVFDPLVCLTVDTTCPACGAAARSEVDLEAVALERLARVQRRLVADVHELARAYGWTEAQALAVPARRRAEYLRLVRETGGSA